MNEENSHNPSAVLQPDTPAETAPQNPFSGELAWQTWLERKEKAAELADEIQGDLHRGAPERELLLKAVRAIGLMTDNSVFARVVEEALRQRDSGG